MNTKSTIPVALALLLAMTSCRPATKSAAELSSDDIAAIKTFEQNWVQAILAGDWAAGAAQHTEEAVRMPPNAPDVRGRTAIQASLGERGRPNAFTLTSKEIEGRGDVAYSWQTFSITLPARGNSPSTTLNGRGLVIFRKQADSAWLADRVIWNFDQPLPE
jgi:ketosteroid isomerase-like protein